MKKIGIANDYKVLLECTEAEYQLLASLNGVANDTYSLTSLIAFRRDFNIDADMSACLKAVWDWMQVKDRANSLQSIVNEIHNNIKG